MIAVRRPSRPLRGAAGHVHAAAVLACLAITVACLGMLGHWAAIGGRWYDVRTPSMGTAAPVGTLLWVAPVDTAELRVGEVVSFHPPTMPRETYSHRIVAVQPDGGLRTRGDLNGSPDPWIVPRHDVIGVVRARWWGVGWLLRAAPLIAGGGLVLLVLSRYFTAQRYRLPVRITGSAALLALACYRLHPLVRAELISFTPQGDGAVAHVVGTGLLPVQLTGNDGVRERIAPGQLGSVLSTTPDAHGRYWVHLSAQVPPWWWAVVVGIGLLPALVTSIVGVRITQAGAPGTGAGGLA